jgi:hypothetical protein
MAMFQLSLLAAAALTIPTRVLALNYTVHSSVIFARIGEHTPFLGSGSVTITSYGAHQMYNLVCIYST